MLKTHKIYSLALLSVFIPSISLALDLSAGNTSKFNDVVSEMISIANLLVPILISLSFIMFFWGLSKFILNSNKPEDIKNGKNYMMWGILALFILITFRTIISLVSNDLGIGGTINIGSFLKTP